MKSAVIGSLLGTLLVVQVLALPAVTSLIEISIKSAQAVDQNQVAKVIETISGSFPDLKNVPPPEIDNCGLYMSQTIPLEDCSSLMWIGNPDGTIGAEFNSVDVLIFKTEQMAIDNFADVSDALNKLTFEEQSKTFAEPFGLYETSDGGSYLRGDAEEYFKCGNLVINIRHSSGGDYKVAPLLSGTDERSEAEFSAMTEEKNRLITKAEPILQSLILDLKGTLESRGICQPGEVMKPQERKPVIFLPGVAGSDLYIGDKQVWPFAFTGYRDQLKLKANGIDSEKPGVVVTTKDIFRKNLLPSSIPIPPYGHVSMPESPRTKINFYGPLIDSLEKGSELFNWDNIPRDTRETDKLLTFLNDKLGITWAIADKSKLKIVKDPSGNSISISDGGPNSLTIHLARSQKSAVLRTTSTPDNKELLYYFYLEETKGLKKIYERNYREGKDLFVFPYDWRYSNKVHFDKLKQTIDTALKQNPQAGKVILVAHSMGGVISKAFLFANPDMASKVDSLITLGTPFWGSPKPFFALMMGYDFGNPMINPQLMKDIGQNFPSVYELTPQSDFVHDSVNRKYLSFEEVFSIKYKGFVKKIPFWKLGIIDKYYHCCPPQDKWVNTANNELSANSDLVKAAIQFHAPGGTIDNPNPLPMGVKLYTIIGKGVKTLDRYEMRDAKDTDKTFLEFGQRKVVLEPRFEDGDGTVPMWSLKISKVATKEYYIPSVPGRPAAHGDLARIPCVNEIVKAITVDNKPPSTTPASCQISPKGKLTGTEKEVDLEKGVDLTLHSDAHLSVVDEDGNTLGYDAFGGITENIPTGAFLDMDGVEYASIADTSRKYKVFVNGTNEGKFTLSVNISARDQQPLVYSYADVPVNNRTISEFDFIPNALSQGSVPDLRVSSNGATKNVAPILLSVGSSSPGDGGMIDAGDETIIDTFDDPIVTDGGDLSNQVAPGQQTGAIQQQPLPSQQKGQQLPEPPIEDMADYDNPDFRLTMKYPSNWAVREYPDFVVFTSPAESEGDTSVESLYVYYLGDIPLGESEEQTLKSNLEATINYREPYSGFQLLSSNNIEFNGKTAGQLEYTYTDTNIGSSKAKEIIAIDGNDRYDILFIANADQYSSTLAAAQEIIDSIEIIPSSQQVDEPIISDQGSSTAGNDKGDAADGTVMTDGGGGVDNQDGVENTITSTSDFKDYSNSDFKLSMKYPSDWTVQENPAQVTFVSPASSGSDQYLESLTISYEGNLPLFETDKETLDKNVEAVIEYQKATLANFEIQESEEIALLGIPAHKIVYTMDDINIGPAKATEIILINGDDRYDLLFVANPDQYDSVLPVVEEMINSIILSQGG